MMQCSMENSYLQVIFRGTHRIRIWSQLSNEEEKNTLRSNCSLINRLMLELFSRGGWNFRNRLDSVSVV